MFDAQPDTSDDREASSLSGLEPLHDLRLTLAEWADWDEVARRLRNAGAEFSMLKMATQGEGVGVRCRVRGLLPAQASVLCAALRDEQLAQSVRVEHLLLR